MFDSLNFNNPALQMNSFQMPSTSATDTNAFSGFANPFASSSGSFGGATDFSQFSGGLPIIQNPSTCGNLSASQTSFGNNSFMNSAFSNPFGNPFQNIGSGFNMNSDFMSMMLSNPFAGMQSSYGDYTVDPKKAESKFSPMIEKYAKQYGIRSDVFKSLVKHESGFNTHATSSKGAKGLTQLMPGTARDMGVTNPYDPEQSIKGGMKYLAKLLKHYNGDYRKAVAAYNGGMGNIDKKGVNFCAETSKYHKAVLG